MTTVTGGCVGGHCNDALLGIITPQSLLSVGSGVPMLYRRSAQLAVEVVLLLALEGEGTSRRVRDLAAELGVSATYLAKIVQVLTRVGLLHALRGPRGGVQLARSAHEIRLWDVVSAVEPVGEFERCFLRLRQCDDQHPCPIHDDWAPIRTRILAMLQKKSMKDIANEAQHSGALAWQRRQKRTYRRPTTMLRRKDGAQRRKADADKD